MVRPKNLSPGQSLRHCSYIPTYLNWLGSTNRCTRGLVEPLESLRNERVMGFTVVIPPHFADGSESFPASSPALAHPVSQTSIRAPRRGGRRLYIHAAPSEQRRIPPKERSLDRAAATTLNMGS